MGGQGRLLEPEFQFLPLGPFPRTIKRELNECPFLYPMLWGTLQYKVRCATAEMKEAKSLPGIYGEIYGL